ncbi:hypothetical protein EPA93_14895 [Ktedonosporobacter rubrisoli]|uniref:Uncharacterized protein n=1 Tax=Ktedonosporobacter rubrisoli TaxID=2509675 RepID=A0A4P6JPR0_KTERU|nr:hypothetical protein [Ktedonosporobacter rubrisoli]QBD77213.1 hypothetical protein EPA93_14895 [Ktedonosporobacter rubrisoli]
MENQTLSIHRLVQAVQKDRMDHETRRHWAERVVRATDAAFPDHPQDVATWPQCLRYLDQVQACYTLIEDYAFLFSEAAAVLHRTGLYFLHHAFYALAEPL